MDGLFKCIDCARPYRFDRLKECPACGCQTPSDYSSKDKPQSSGRLEETRLPENSRTRNESRSQKERPEHLSRKFLDLEISELQVAENRTTHAVRAIAIYLVVNTLWMLISGVLVILAMLIPQQERCPYGFCTYSPNGFAVFLFVVAGLVAIGGLVFALVSAIRELRDSRIGESLF